MLSRPAEYWLWQALNRHGFGTAPDVGLGGSDKPDAAEPELERFADPAALEGLGQPDVGEPDVIVIEGVEHEQVVRADAFTIVATLLAAAVPIDGFCSGRRQTVP